MRKFNLLALILAASLLAGCALNQSWLPGSGALTAELTTPPIPENPDAPTVQLVEVTPAVAQKVMGAQKITEFSETFKTPPNNGMYSSVVTTSKTSKMAKRLSPLKASRCPTAKLAP